MQQQEQTVPTLRFPEFSGDWRPSKLGNFTSKVSDGIHTTPKYCDDGEYFFINGNNLQNGKIIISDNTKRLQAREARIHEKDLNDNTILISINGTIGSLAFYEGEKVVLGKSAGYLNILDKSEKKFIFYLMQTHSVQREFFRGLTGTTIKNLGIGTIKGTKVKAPSIKQEQQKIATFLGAVDEKITQLQKKKDLLEDYKKGCMQKLFSQELRFTDDNGSSFPDWEERKLGQISECLDNKRKPLNSSERALMQGSYPYYGANGHLDNISDYIFDEPLILLAEDGGNFDEFANRPIAQSISGKTWVNNHAHVLRAKKGVSTHEYLFQSLVNKDIRKYINGSSRAKLNKSDMLGIEMLLPCIEEQNKIADFLSAIDSKIKLVAEELDKAKTFKKGLLQQMFV